MKVLSSRATALGFAKRARKNLRHIEQASAGGADVHVITQIVTSVLGMVVFPWEKYLVRQLRKRRLDDLYALGWPRWRISIGYANTLSDLTLKLRNATAHGRYQFSSDDRDPEKVELIVEDAYEGEVNWRARISSAGLKDFCYRFLDLIEDELG